MFGELTATNCLHERERNCLENFPELLVVRFQRQTIANDIMAVSLQHSPTTVKNTRVDTWWGFLKYSRGGQQKASWTLLSGPSVPRIGFIPWIISSHSFLSLTSHQIEMLSTSRWQPIHLLDPQYLTPAKVFCINFTIIFATLCIWTQHNFTLSTFPILLRHLKSL